MSTAPAAKAAKTEKTEKTEKIEFERVSFRALILANPNYFGTLKGSKLKPVKAFSGNTSYEQLMCCGFHPQLSQLEAVVHVKKNAGYTESLCHGGSPEYVRFFTSSDGGATWVDQGLTSFHAYNVAGPRPLEYAVSLGINPRRTFCFKENLLKVRAILSWNVAPTPGDPNFIPVWGNVLNVDVQVEPRRLWIWKDIIKEAEIKIPGPLQELPIFDQPIEIGPKDPIGPVEMQKLYAKTDVPAHRFMFEHLAQANFDEGPLGASMMLHQGLIDQIAELKIDIGAILGQLAKVNGDTSYEELSCVGYDPNNDALIGVIKVKKSAGYSGSLCTPGSREYVAFWVDWGDGSGWTYEGTSSVKVHDIASVPKAGLFYAVFEALGSAKRRKHCIKGPVTAKVRAILSWQAVPPAGNPNYVPTWGNRMETTIQLNPGGVAEDYRPFLESVGSVPVCSIDQATGLTSGGYPQPFGGVLTITGMIPTAPDISTPDPNKLRYRVKVRRSGVINWQTVANDFTISVIERIGMALPTQYYILQQADANGFYIYREDMNVAGAGWRLVQNRVLAQWITADPMTGMYEIMVEAWDPVTNTMYGAQTLACGDGTFRTNVNVWLDELRPTLALAIIGYQKNGVGPVLPAQVCQTFTIGDIIHGTYGVHDAHTGGFRMTIEPAAMANGALPSPSARSYPVVPNLGENGTWTLNTEAMDACGFVVHLHGYDRTIVSSDGPWYDDLYVGFCLKKG